MRIIDICTWTTCAKCGLVIHNETGVCSSCLVAGDAKDDDEPPPRLMVLAALDAERKTRIKDG